MRRAGTSTPRTTGRELAARALETLLDAQPPPEVTIDGNPVALAAERREDALSILCSWKNGRIPLTIRGTQGSKGLFLDVHPSSQRVHILSPRLQRPIEKALGRGDEKVEITLNNSFFRRRDKGINAIYGQLSKEIAGRSGLSDEASIHGGTFNVKLRAWEGGPAAFLTRLITLSVIKAHFMAAGREAIEGEPLFTPPAPSDDEGDDDDGDDDDVDDVDTEARRAARAQIEARLVEKIPSRASRDHVLRVMADAAARAAALNPDSWVPTITKAGLQLNVGPILAFAIRDGVLWATDDPSSAARAKSEHDIEPFRAIDGLYLARAQADDVVAAWDSLAPGFYRALDLAARRSSPFHRYFSPDFASYLEEVHGERFADVEELGDETELLVEELRDPSDGKPLDLADLRLDPEAVRQRLVGFLAPPGVLERCCAALNAGKNLLDRRQFEFPVGDIYFCRSEAGEAPPTAITRAG